MSDDDKKPRTETGPDAPEAQTEPVDPAPEPVDDDATPVQAESEDQKELTVEAATQTEETGETVDEAPEAFEDDAPSVQAETEEQRELTAEAGADAAETNDDAPGPDGPAAPVEGDDSEANIAAPAPQEAADSEATADTGAAATGAAATTASKPADAVRTAIMDRMPDDMAPYLSLSRFDRPVGFWLLALPCFIGLAFTRIQGGWQWMDIVWLALFAIGSIAMRGAGCTWNDIQDRDIDAQVERTRARPIPSGRIKLSEAWMWLGIQLVVGFLVWACLPLDAKIVALLAIPLVAAYPFMKRLTWWPQAWLGATMSWGALVAAATASSISLGTVILFLGLACWVVAYDTVYAISDREDDEMVGVKSTARLFEKRTGVAVFGFFVAATVLIALAAAAQGAGRIGALTALLFLAHGTWQVLKLRRDREARAIEVFRSNVGAGIILFLGLAIAALFGYGNSAEAEAETPAEAVEGTPAPAPAEETGGGSWWVPEATQDPAPETPFGNITPTPGEDAARPQPATEPETPAETGDGGGFNPFGDLFGGDQTEDAALAEPDGDATPEPEPEPEPEPTPEE